MFLLGENGWYVTFKNSGFSLRNFGQRVAKIFGMVHRDGSHHANKRRVDNVGGVEFAT